MDHSTDFWPPGAFIKHLASRLGITKRRTDASSEDWDIHTLDLSVLKLNVGFYTQFIVPHRFSAYKNIPASQVEPLLPRLHEHVRAANGSFVVVVVGGTIHDEAELIQPFGKRSIAIISRPSIEAVMNSTNNDRALNKLSEPLVRYLGRAMLSPYRPGKPAHAGRFFGRLEALTQATSGGKMGGNFTIMGNRRIGKTSLLREIKARLLRDNAKLKTADIYGNNFHSALEVVKEILVHLRPDLAKRLEIEPQLADNLPAHISFLPERQNEDVAVFIDELDHILEFDAKENYKLLNLLRATFEHERCRIFFAGFRRVMEAKNHLETPLYNFTQPLPLTSLTKTETHDMITAPFSRLGVPVSPGLPEAIMHETSGHPELVQMFCAKVVEYFEIHGHPPAAVEVIATIVEDNVFRQTVYLAFIKNTNPIEQLACFALMSKAAISSEDFSLFQFTMQDIDAVMKEHGMNLRLDELHLLTENLRIGGVIGQIQGVRSRAFRFAVPRLAEYCIADDLDFSILKTKEELATTPGVVTVLMDAEKGFDDLSESGTY